MGLQIFELRKALAHAPYASVGSDRDGVEDDLCEIQTSRIGQSESRGTGKGVGC